MDENEKNTKYNENINVSLGTTIVIAAITIIAFLALVVWISMKIQGLA